MATNTVTIRRIAGELMFLDSATDLLTELVNEHRARQIAVRLSIAGRQILDSPTLSVGEATRLGEHIKSLIDRSGCDGTATVTLHVTLLT